MEHGLKVIAFYVQKACNTLHRCHNFPACSRQAARGTRICETSLLTEAEWRIESLYALRKLGPGNGLSPFGTEPLSESMLA